MLGNGQCDKECNTYACAYDLGDCDNDTIGYNTFRRLRDEYEQAIWNSHRLIEMVFGRATFKAAMHYPIIMNKRIWKLIEYIYPSHYKQAISNRFRKWTDFQYQYTFEAFLYELDILNTSRLDLLFYLLDDNKDGVLSESEILSLDTTSRLSSIIFKQGIRICFGKVFAIDLDQFTSCNILHKITRRIFSYLGKHTDVSRRGIWNPQMKDSIEYNIGILQSIKNRSLTFLCINDGMNTVAEQMQPILREFFESTFPEKSPFEI